MFRKFNGKLIVKPSKKSMKAIVSKLSETINKINDISSNATAI